MQDRTRADFAISAELRVVQFCGGIDGRFYGKHFASHANFHEKPIQRMHVIDGVDDKVMTVAQQPPEVWRIAALQRTVTPL